MSDAGATAWERTSERRPRRAAPASPFPVILAALLLIVLSIGAVAHVNGIRWYTIKTPSMGTALPVGSLVVTHPTRVADVHPGDVVTFTAPSGSTYSHRVVATTGAELTTKGDINGTPDPWRITDATLVGVSIFSARYLGWAVTGAPYLCIGWLLVALLTAVVPAHWRRRTGFLGTILVLDAVLLWLKPFTGAVALAYQQVEGGMRAFVVSTGVFPIRVAAQTGGYADLKLGEYAPVLATAPNAQGRFLYIPTLHMAWPWWLGVILVSLLPLAYSLLVGFPEVDDDDSEDDTPQRGRGLGAKRALAVGAGIAVLASGVAAEPAHAAFTSAVKNSKDTVGTRTFFTCDDAMFAFNTVTPAAGLHGRLYSGWRFDKNLDATYGQGANSPYKPQYTNTTSSSTVGCVTDKNKRGNVGTTLNGSSSQIDESSESSVSEATGDPGDTDNMTFQVWFRAADTKGGVLSCLSGINNVCSEQALYIDTTGHLNFFENNNVLTSTQVVADGKWHMAVAQVATTTNNATAGLRLWLDGVLIQSLSTSSGSAGVIAYPQFGYSAGSETWKNWPTGHLYFNGDLQFCAIYGRDANGNQIGQSEVTAIYQAAMP